MPETPRYHKETKIVLTDFDGFSTGFTGFVIQGLHRDISECAEYTRSRGSGSGAPNFWVCFGIS